MEEVIAYKVNGKLFESKDDAERYQYEVIDPVQIGDIVSTNGFQNMLGMFGCQGRVSKIDGERIWFISGYYPEDLLMSGTIDYGMRKRPNFHYEWQVFCHPRASLFRRAMPTKYNDDIFNILNQNK